MKTTFKIFSSVIIDDWSYKIRVVIFINCNGDIGKSMLQDLLVFLKIVPLFGVIGILMNIHD